MSRGKSALKALGDRLCCACVAAAGVYGLAFVLWSVYHLPALR